MKRLVCLLCALTVLALPLCSLAVEIEPLSGVGYLPAGADEGSAKMIVTYRLPQFGPQTQVNDTINAHMRFALSLILADAQLTYSGQQLDGEAAHEQSYITVDYQTFADTDDYVSVLISVSDMSGATEAQTAQALTYARSGEYEGQQLTLSQLTGLETDSTAEESTLSTAVQALVWDIISQPSEDFTVEYFPDLTREDIQRAFTPEKDFYLDNDGNIVFFLQPGIVASEMYGIVTFPFARAELLSEMKE